MKFFYNFLLCLMAGFFIFISAGCEEKGPAEKAGKEVDKAVDDVKDKLKKAFD